MAQTGAIELTESRINKLIAEAKSREVRDRAEKGLLLRITATGSASWSVQYRRRDGSKGRVTLGTYTNAASRRSTRKALPLAAARAEAVRIRAAIANGRDPVEAKAEERRKEIERQAALAAEISVAEMLELWLARKQGLRTNDDDRAMFMLDVIAPKSEASPLGAKRLSTVTKRDVSRAVDRAVGRGSPVTATRLLRRLSTAFKWAVDSGYIATNPCNGIQHATNYKDRVRERVLSAHEIRAFLTVLPVSGLAVAHQRVLQLELLLGQRISEICGMRKLELNLVDGLWTIPGERTKNESDHLCPLPPLARSIILAAMADAARCRQCEGCQSGSECADPRHSPFVFPNQKGTGPILGNTVSHALERIQETKDEAVPPILTFLHPQTGEPHPFTSHDLRRTLGTQIEKLGVSVRVVGKLLNHTEKKSVTEEVYSHAELLAERYEALVRWQRALQEVMDGRDPFAFSVANFRDIEKRILGEPMKLIGSEVSP